MREVWKTIDQQPFVTVSFLHDRVAASGGIINVKHESHADFPTCTDQTVTSFVGDATSATLTGELCAHQPIQYNLTFSLSPLSKNQLDFNVKLETTSGWDAQYTPRATLSYSSRDEEGFYGLGEQYSFLNLRNQSVALITREKGTGRGLQPLTTILNLGIPGEGGGPFTSYMTIPYYQTSQQRSLYLTSTDYTEFDFAKTTSDLVVLQVNATRMSGTLILADTAFDIIEEFTLYAGRMAPLPTWVSNGAIIGMEGGSDVVRSNMEQIRSVAPDMPIAGVWCQDWSGVREFPNRKGLWWNWEIDDTLYHDWSDLIQYLSEFRTAGTPQAVRMLTYVNPMLADVTNKTTPTKNNYFLEAKAKGYLVKEQLGDGSQQVWLGYNGAGLLDLRNDEARTWFKTLMAGMLQSNHSGWMADFGESFPLGATDFGTGGESAASYHNRYPEEWARLNQEVIREAGKTDEILYFARSGSTRSPGVTSAFWLGDQLVSWDKHDGIKTAVTGMITLGLSGLSISHSDIGGYAMVPVPILGIQYLRTKELLLRWCELSAFTPIYRSHLGTNPETGAQFNSDTETLLHYAKFASVFAALGPYRQGLMAEASAKGYPIVRAMHLHFPDDSEAYKLPLQYMLGASLLVAPVLDEKASDVRVYLPKGEWVHMWTNTTYGNPTQGEWVVMQAPIGQPAVFHKGSRMLAKLIPVFQAL